MKLFKVLDSDQINLIKSEIKNCNWSAGEKSAEGNAKNIKRNIEINSLDKNFSNIFKYINHAHNNQTVKAYTYIKEIINPMVVKYSIEDKYDWHVDVSLMANKRTDLSFTIFLNDFNEYKGGELEVISNNQKILVNGKSGEIFIYPSGLLHRVNMVTSGERLVIVGWLTSHIKIEEHRMRLFDLSSELTKLRNNHNINLPELDKLYFQLIRDYSN